MGTARVLPGGRVTRSPMTLASALLSRRQFRARLGDALLDAIESTLDGTAPEQAPLRRALRRMKDDLLVVQDINVLHPATQQAVLALASVGLCTTAHAIAVLSVPFEDTLPNVAAPAGTVDARWDGWRVWAVQCPPGEQWSVQTPLGDTTINHPDYLVTHQIGGAQYRARATEIVLV